MLNEICITFDYELHLGSKTGSVHDCLIFPTQEIMKVFDRYDIKATLFVDASYLLMIEKYRGHHRELDRDYQLIVSQLQQLCRNGHSIQLHLHPQWHYSRFEGSGWKLDFDHYKLSDLDSGDIPAYFSGAKALLESISGKRVVAFRAGGYSLQSYRDHCNLLISNNIYVDSSVVPGKVVKSAHQWYDFSAVPWRKYTFSSEISLPDENGMILEIPISAVPFRFVRYLLERKWAEMKHDFLPFSDFSGNQDPFSLRMVNVAKELFRPKIVMASMDGFLASLLPLVYRKFAFLTDDSLFVITGHPKNFSRNSIRYTESFIQGTLGRCAYKTIEEFIPVR